MTSTHRRGVVLGRHSKHNNRLRRRNDSWGNAVENLTFQGKSADAQSGRHVRLKIGWLIWPQTAAGPVNFLHIPRRILLEFVFGAVSALSYLDSYLLLNLLILCFSDVLPFAFLFRFVLAISF